MEFDIVNVILVLFQGVVTYFARSLFETIGKLQLEHVSTTQVIKSLVEITKELSASLTKIDEKISAIQQKNILLENNYEHSTEGMAKLEKQVNELNYKLGGFEKQIADIQNRFEKGNQKFALLEQKINNLVK